MSVRLLVTLLAVAAAALTACGDDSNLIAPNDASRLTDRLAAVRTAMENGECTTAKDDVKRVRAAAQALPASVDRRLRARINDGVRALESEVPRDCGAQQEEQQQEPQVTPTETTETQPETTQTQTTPPETTQTETAPTTSTPTTTETTPSTTEQQGSSSGGAPAQEGVTP